jgi:hypothetical protein
MGIIAASRLRAEAIYVNTVFGGIGDVISTPALLSDQISLTEENIELFEIDSDNSIRFSSTDFYQNRTNNYKSNNTTFYYDFDGKIGRLSQYFFELDSPINRIISFSNAELEVQCFRLLTVCEYIILPEVTTSIGGGNINQINTLKRIYLPKWYNDDNSSFGGTTYEIFFGLASNNNTIWYFQKTLETIQAGTPHESLQRIISDGGQIRYIDNFDKPNAVADLSVSNITSNSVQLDFTPPTVNTNANDFYYVYIDYVGIIFKFKYSTRHEISAFFKEISASGDVLTGLPSGTEITMQIQTVDYYHNVSDYSNIVTFTTS